MPSSAVRVNGKNLLAAGFNVMYAGPIRGPAVSFDCRPRQVPAITSISLSTTHDVRSPDGPL